MIWVVILVAAAMLFLGFELFLVLAVPVYLIKESFYASLPDAILLQRMIGGINHSILLAIPFFIFAGELMAGGRIARLLSRSAEACFRAVRGGSGHATITACMAFGSVSGSAPATVAALGRLMHPRLLEAGFSDRFSVGLIISAAETALLIPPSISLIIYGWLTGTSISRLFAAGLAVGVVLGAAFSALVLWEVWRRDVDQRAERKGAAAEAMKGTVWALGMPVVILGGIYSGVFTATEAAAVSVLYAVFVETVVFRSLGLRGLVHVAQRSAVLTAIIFMMLGAGSMLAYFVTIAHFPETILEFMRQMRAGPVLFLLIVNVAFLIAGMFIDPGAAQLVLVPALFPVATSFGIDPVHFGMVIGVNVCIAMITPPFGLDIFVAASTLNKKVVDITRGVGPFVAVNLVVLLIVTYVPGVATAFPNLLFGRAS
ncbi:MAG: TRAP transporter large permease [Betaproteobacteria bacterium]|nr:MAG: TRAP transporter large permease [Betaproteobacteria bacterium]